MTPEKPAIPVPHLRTIADEVFSGMEHTIGNQYRLQDTPRVAREHEASPSQDTRVAFEGRHGSTGRHDHLVSCWQGTDCCLGRSQTSRPTNLRFAYELSQFFDRLYQDHAKHITITATILPNIHDSYGAIQQSHWAW